MTKDQITLAGFRCAIELGLTKRKDQRVLVKAYGALLQISEFLGDVDKLLVATEASRSIYERLSKKGKRQYEAGLVKVCEALEAIV